MVTLTENFERRLQVRVMLMILLLILRLFVMLMQEAGKRSKELKGKIADLKVSIHHQGNIFNLLNINQMEVREKEEALKESTELMEMYAGKICHHDNQNHNHHIIDIGGMLQNHYQDQILNNTPLLCKYSTTIITIIVIIIVKAEDPPAGKLAKAEKRLEDEVIIISILN